LSPEEARRNAESYAEQAFRILDRDNTEIRFNDEWLSQLTFAELIHLASNFTVQQFMTRLNFRQRWQKDEAVYFHEFFYALMQGYDAYALDADIQVGGTDQMFNIMTAARKIMAYYDKKPNVGIILGILPGTDGEVKMSKSLGNHIPLNTSPEDMFGKVMSVPDKAMSSYARLVTRWSVEKIKQFENDVTNGEVEPMMAKKDLAHEITAAFYSEDQADGAKIHFQTVIQQGSTPDEIPEYPVDKEVILIDALRNSETVQTNSEVKRLVKQGGIKVNDMKVSDPYLSLEPGAIIKVGKRRFLKIVSINQED